jgi:nucleoside-triphosphatase THEP1
MYSKIESMEHTLSEKWIKASIAGTIWAASEIVLGSFLHNLRIPFSGNILTAIGLIILIAISYKWTEKGLFWRAGLICALMKTMSPSAIIFGPMIAIFSESLLLELSVRLLGRTIGGYLIGSMLAMSWNLFQKIANYIIYYGSDIIEVYNNLLRFAQKQLNIQTEIVWMPIIILLVIYALFGCFAGIIGIRVGRKMIHQPYSTHSSAKQGEVQGITGNNSSSFNYSVIWLIADIIFIIISFILLNRTSWIVWSLSIISVIILWSFRYKRALRQLAKPKFWIFFVIITLLAAFAFTKAQPGDIPLINGLLTGIQMNFRAAIIIVGFSVLGIEFYNPVIRKFFLRTSFKNLPLALELSTESLPSFISGIPDFKSLVRDPVSIFYHVISQAEGRFSEIIGKNNNNRKIIIITGSVGEGKTSYVKNMIGLFPKYDIKPGGFISERVMEKSHTTGYDIVNIETGKRDVFLRENNCGPDKIGRYNICQEGLSAGNNILRSVVHFRDILVIIDEVGRLELDGKGWAEGLKELIDKSMNNILITVRNSFVEDVTIKFGIRDAVIVNVSETGFPDAVELISKIIKN